MAEQLALFLPSDPHRAQAIRLWAAERGYELVERRRGRRLPERKYPWTCKHGHRVLSPDDEFTRVDADRTYRWCAACRRNTRNASKRARRARGVPRHSV